jgi:hypothetical protein
MAPSPRTKTKTLRDCSVFIALESVRWGRGFLFVLSQTFLNLPLFFIYHGSGCYLATRMVARTRIRAHGCF